MHGICVSLAENESLLRLKYTDLQYYRANIKYAIWVKFCNVSSGNNGSTIILHCTIGTLSKLSLFGSQKRILLVEYNMKKICRNDSTKKYNGQKIGVRDHKRSECNSFDIGVVLMRTEIEENIFSYGSQSEDITP